MFKTLITFWRQTFSCVVAEIVVCAPTLFHFLRRFCCSFYPIFFLSRSGEFHRNKLFIEQNETGYLIFRIKKLNLIVVCRTNVDSVEQTNIVRMSFGRRCVGVENFSVQNWFAAEFPFFRSFSQPNMQYKNILWMSNCGFSSSFTDLSSRTRYGPTQR